LSVVCLIAIVYYNALLSVIFFGLMVVMIIIFIALGKHKTLISDTQVQVSDTTMLSEEI
jgi:ethanolamine permease